MRGVPEVAVYLATFGSMTAAAAVVIGLIVFTGGDDDGDTVSAVVAVQNIAAGTEISEEMLIVFQVPEEVLVAGAYSDTRAVIGQVTTVEIASGEMVTPSKVVTPSADSGSRSYYVPPGQRHGPVVASHDPSFR
jgi:Flp pilus assembly protein CpaB